MLSDTSSQKILPQFGFDHFEFISRVNHSGGLAVLWNTDNIYVSILSKESRAIHLLVYDSAIKALSILSGVYGPAKSRDKNGFWDKLTAISTIFDLP